ncbi:hypothetical protein [Peribacillus simplex]|uniref:hypothetical protein n=1 Tax=Peribacillus simplex TaxID=1478 RepID=UPI003D2A0BD6
MIEKVGKPEAVAADVAYKTLAITSYLFWERNHTSFTLYTSTNKRRVLSQA